MSSSPASIPSQEQSPDCPQCGTLWRLKRGLCVSCLLSHGLDSETLNSESLDAVLEQIDVCDAC